MLPLADHRGAARPQVPAKRQTTTFSGALSYSRADSPLTAALKAQIASQSGILLRNLGTNTHGKPPAAATRAGRSLLWAGGLTHASKRHRRPCWRIRRHRSAGCLPCVCARAPRINSLARDAAAATAVRPRAPLRRRSGPRAHAAAGRAQHGSCARLLLAHDPQPLPTESLHRCWTRCCAGDVCRKWCWRTGRALTTRRSGGAM